jgi:hypothetical protein
MTRNLIEQQNFYSTSDMALAAVISLYCPIEEVDRSDPRKAQFLFRQSDDLDRLVGGYWRGQLQIEPQQFFNQLRIIKARLYGGE